MATVNNNTQSSSELDTTDLTGRALDLNSKGEVLAPTGPNIDAKPVPVRKRWKRVPKTRKVTFSPARIAKSLHVGVMESQTTDAENIDPREVHGTNCTQAGTKRAAAPQDDTSTRVISTATKRFKPARPDDQQTTLLPSMSANAAQVSPPPPASLHGRKGTWSESDFVVGSILGRGQFGAVYRGTSRNGNRVVALKMIQKQKVAACNDTPFCLRREVEIQCRLRHQNILGLFGYFSDASTVYLVLEHAPGGNLYEFMRKSRSGEKRAARLVAQVASALSYLQSRHVSHRDIKPENLLVFPSSDGSVKLKLCDFGWSVHAPPPHNMRRTLCGTPEYIPIEMLSSNKAQGGPSLYDARRVDNWTLGVLAYEMVAGVTPFFCFPDDKARVQGRSTTNDLIYDKIRAYARESDASSIFPEEGRGGGKLKVSHSFSTGFRDLVQGLMKSNPGDRLSVEEVLQHPWVQRLKKKRMH